MSESDCTPCDKTDDGEIKPNPICARCNKEVNVEEEYEELAGAFIHKFCYDEALLGIVLSAPSVAEVRQLQSMRKMVQNFMPGGMGGAIPNASSSTSELRIRFDNEPELKFDESETENSNS